MNTPPYCDTYTSHQSNRLSCALSYTCRSSRRLLALTSYLHSYCAWGKYFVMHRTYAESGYHAAWMRSVEIWAKKFLLLTFPAPHRIVGQALFTCNVVCAAWESTPSCWSDQMLTYSNKAFSNTAPSATLLRWPLRSTEESQGGAVNLSEYLAGRLTKWSSETSAPV